MKPLKSLLFFSFFLIVSASWATTWNEPWQDSVIKQADYFVFARIKSNSARKGVSIEIIKTLAGENLNGKLKITNFYLLDLCSVGGGHGAEFNFDKKEECYFFIKKNSKGKYCIATPTSGFALIKNGKVYATYRHSYHQALVPIDVYEKTMTAIFNSYHNQAYDKRYITNYIDSCISLKPAGFSETEINTFFAQHVALECVYHLRLNNYYSKLLPFLADTNNFHNQVSAARALVANNTTQCKQELLNVIRDKKKGDFVKVICVWTLSAFKPTELKEPLLKEVETASTDDTGFGGSIMDPRVCTQFPDVKSALEKLIKLL